MHTVQYNIHGFRPDVAHSQFQTGGSVHFADPSNDKNVGEEWTGEERQTLELESSLQFPQNASLSTAGPGRHSNTGHAAVLSGAASRFHWTAGATNFHFETQLGQFPRPSYASGWGNHRKLRTFLPVHLGDGWLVVITWPASPLLPLHWYRAFMDA
jgi:hypothetical protein